MDQNKFEIVPLWKYFFHNIMTVTKFSICNGEAFTAIGVILIFLAMIYGDGDGIHLESIGVVIDDGSLWGGIVVLVVIMGFSYIGRIKRIFTHMSFFFAMRNIFKRCIIYPTIGIGIITVSTSEKLVADISEWCQDNNNFSKKADAFLNTSTLAPRYFDKRNVPYTVDRHEWGTGSFGIVFSDINDLVKFRMIV